MAFPKFVAVVRRAAPTVTILRFIDCGPIAHCQKSYAFADLKLDHAAFIVILSCSA